MQPLRWYQEWGDKLLACPEPWVKNRDLLAWLWSVPVMPSSCFFLTSVIRMKISAGTEQSHSLGSLVILITEIPLASSYWKATRQWQQEENQEPVQSDLALATVWHSLLQRQVSLLFGMNGSFLTIGLFFQLPVLKRWKCSTHPQGTATWP